MLGPEADGAGRRGSRDGVVVLLDVRGRGTVVLGAEGVVDGGVEVLGGEEPHVALGRGNHEGGGGGSARHVWMCGRGSLDEWIM